MNQNMSPLGRTTSESIITTIPPWALRLRQFFGGADRFKKISIPTPAYLGPWAAECLEDRHYNGGCFQATAGIVEKGLP